MRVSDSQHHILIVGRPRLAEPQLSVHHRQLPRHGASKTEIISSVLYTFLDRNDRTRWRSVEVWAGPCQRGEIAEITSIHGLPPNLPHPPLTLSQVRHKAVHPATDSTGAFTWRIPTCSTPVPSSPRDTLALSVWRGHGYFRFFSAAQALQQWHWPKRNRISSPPFRTNSVHHRLESTPVEALNAQSSHQ